MSALKCKENTAWNVTCFEHESIKDKSFSGMLCPRVVCVLHRPQHVNCVQLKQCSSVSAVNSFRKPTQQISRLHNTNVGCYRSATCCRIVLYADTIVLIAPSVSALQILLNACEEELLAMLTKRNQCAFDLVNVSLYSAWNESRPVMVVSNGLIDVII